MCGMQVYFFTRKRWNLMKTDPKESMHRATRDILHLFRSLDRATAVSSFIIHQDFPEHFSHVDICLCGLTKKY